MSPEPSTPNSTHAEVVQEGPEEIVRVTVLIPKSIDRAMEMAASKLDITKSRFVAEAILLYLGQPGR